MIRSFWTLFINLYTNNNAQMTCLNPRNASLGNALDKSINFKLKNLNISNVATSSDSFDNFAMHNLILLHMKQTKFSIHLFSRVFNWDLYFELVLNISVHVFIR